MGYRNTVSRVSAFAHNSLTNLVSIMLRDPTVDGEYLTLFFQKWIEVLSII